jgi:hypothetical protein
LIALSMRSWWVLLMPIRRPVLALAFASALTGCVSTVPKGPIAEYRPGSPSVSGKATCDASYTLVSQDENGLRGTFGDHRLRRGERVGFRPEADGSVTAIAPDYVHSLPSGSYAWVAVPGKIPSASERLLCDARRNAFNAAKVAAIVVVGSLAFIGFMILVL